jgi:hypothetical protein
MSSQVPILEFSLYRRQNLQYTIRCVKTFLGLFWGLAHLLAFTPNLNPCGWPPVTEGLRL